MVPAITNDSNSQAAENELDFGSKSKVKERKFPIHFFRQSESFVVRRTFGGCSEMIFTAIRCPRRPLIGDSQGKM